MMGMSKDAGNDAYSSAFAWMMQNLKPVPIEWTKVKVRTNRFNNLLGEQEKTMTDRLKESWSDCFEGTMALR